MVHFQLDRGELSQSGRCHQVPGYGRRRTYLDVRRSLRRTLPFADNEKRTFIDITFRIDFDSSVEHLPVFVLNMLKLCCDSCSENEITSSTGYIFDQLIQYFIRLDAKSTE